jgi:arginase
VTIDAASREVAVIGAPLDLGAGRRGVDMGPSAIRYAELEQQLADKLGVRSPTPAT